MRSCTIPAIYRVEYNGSLVGTLYYNVVLHPAVKSSNAESLTTFYIKKKLINIKRHVIRKGGHYVIHHFGQVPVKIKFGESRRQSVKSTEL